MYIGVDWRMCCAQKINEVRCKNRLKNIVIIDENSSYKVNYLEKLKIYKLTEY